jgi:asparagine synthase (glutamine-hydrolysing)
MCGIAGIVRCEGDGERIAAAMAGALAARGPDASGVWAGEGVALGHRRLAVLDLSPAGAQPMHSATGRYVIVFNGEIYNHLELRDRLGPTAGGSAWRGHSDTETILACFEAWGIGDTLPALSGMFAFALWDRSERCLWLARDRIGEKPLYYGWCGSQFVFGSELKALAFVPGWRGEVDQGALRLLLRYGYIPAPHSIYRNISKLLPGTTLRLEFGAAIGTQPAPAPYWSTADEAGAAQGATLDDPVQAESELEFLLGRAVERQMVADVPLGAFLSGGVDSSVIVALMQRATPRPVQTFTIGFRESGYDEAEHAAAVARHLGTEHTQLYVSSDEARAVIPSLPDLYDEPFADSSQIPTHLLARLAHGKVVVALSGDGGDELFAGYNRYVWGSGIWRLLSRIPVQLRRAAANAVLSMSPATWDSIYSRARVALPRRLHISMAGHKVHKLANVIDAPTVDEMHRRLLSQWPDPAEFFRAGPEAGLWADGELSRAGQDDFVYRMMLHDQVGYLPDDILVKVDRAAMGVSLETRVPMLDHELVRFAWRVPLSMKLRDGQSKWLLRQVLYKHVPRELIERPKQGFEIPLDAWLRGPLRDWAEGLLDERKLTEDGYFRADRVRLRWQEHLSGRRNWQYGLWPILMFQAWKERWL